MPDGFRSFARDISTDPMFLATINYLTTLFGAAAMHVFSLHKGFEGSVTFLKKVLPDRTQVFYDRLDSFVVIIAGSIIGTIVFSPNSTINALAAGLGWVAAINTLMNKPMQKPTSKLIQKPANKTMQKPKG